MKKIVLLFSLLACFAATDVMAQAGVSAKVKNNPTAERIARRAIAKLKKSAYKTRFAFIYYNATDETTEVNKGELTIDGLMFRVDMNGIETKYDGLTQWVYFADNNEVTISEPARDELVESNPMMMIDHYMERHRVNLANEQEEGIDVINFFPINPKNCDFFKITFRIDSETLLPRQMDMWQRSGDRVTLKWELFEETEVEKSFFRFDPSRYPGVEISDMR